MAQVTRNAEAMSSLPWAHLRLPPFPMVAMRVLQLVNKENAQLHQIAELISSDPAFASEVLTVANSPVYALHYPVNSIMQAVAVMGGNALQGMCVTVGVRAYLGKSMAQPSMKTLWRHNLACALLAQHLAAASGLDKDTAYTAGILHDIGRAALAVIQPKEYSTLLAQHKGTPKSMMECERELFGWDHCETGLELIKNWKLSEQFAVVIEHHHMEAESQAEWDLSQIVKIGCRMADAAGFPAFPGCECIPYADLLAEVPVEVLEHLNPDVAALTREIGEAIYHVEHV
ncbi:MAG: HDOD domain-containing protein [Terracidiphilus sp.]|nr:HDOD domain-containing protein [Terracidiphilus sp.]